MLIDYILDGGADVVIANPPYIVDPDAERRRAIRARYESAHARFGLGAPFTERLFQLVREGGYIAQITSNAFMKREYGRPLVETVLPRWDTTHVIDTSGAYIPGHGTPTVILAARARAPQSDRIRAVLSKRGEPSTPPPGEPGQVWRAILDGLRHPGAELPSRGYGIEGSRIVVDVLKRGRAVGIEKRLGARLGPALLGAALVLAFRDRRWIRGETIESGFEEIAETTGIDPLVRVELTAAESAELLTLLQSVKPPAGPGSLMPPAALDEQRPRLGWSSWDTDWLGDLYQATHEGTVARDALCQTPWFVRDLLLDLAVEPALDEIVPRDDDGYRQAFRRLRVLDPACGTGHLLVGAFWRLFGSLMDSMECTAHGAADRALQSVEGVELTPETSALARLRLVLAWCDATGYGLARLGDGEVAGDRYSLDHVADRLNIAVGNSLLQGCEGRRRPDGFTSPAPVLVTQLGLFSLEAAE